MRGLGSDTSVNELTSYLLFDSEFCGALVDLGIQDVAAERERIERFFTSGTPPSAPSSAWPRTWLGRRWRS
jgi:hypothetical protein